MAKLKTYEDYIEDSTMREVHRIREQLDREQRESGLSYFEWLEATDKDLRQSLAEVGFEIVTRDGRTFLDEIEPSIKKNNGKYKTDFQKSLAEDGFRMVTRSGETFIEEIEPQTKDSEEPIPKTAKHKNYDDCIEDSTMRELHFIREKMEQEYRKSGFASYDEWLQATEPDMRQSLAEVGFEIVTRDGRTFLDKIKSQPKKRVKYKTVSKRSKTNVRKK